MTDFSAKVTESLDFGVRIASLGFCPGFSWFDVRSICEGNGISILEFESRGAIAYVVLIIHTSFGAFKRKL